MMSLPTSLRKSEVVVVKGKLKLCSVSGLVAVLGIMVLLVGVVMAALGYWPREGLFFTGKPLEGSAMASVSSISSAPVEAQGGEWEHGDDRRRGDHFNQTEIVNGTTRQLPRGFLQEFLDRYLYSDRLKVFGPLIMGIGIFLFICANAVLHENRDKKTKVINLRDIYSTVIDLHASSCSARCSSANPLNGIVNYVQSKSLEAKPKAYPALLMSRREGGGGLLLKQPLPGGDTVFSIYQPDTSPPPCSSSFHRLSLPPSLSPPLPSTCWTTLQQEALGSFTLPLRRPRPLTPRRRHSARARAGGREEGGGVRKEDVFPPPPLCLSTPPIARPFQETPSAVSCSSSSLLREAPGGSQGLLLYSSSHLSLSSLSHLLFSSSSVSAPPCRRRSLPTGSINTGYSKLTHGEDELFESTEMTSSHQVTAQGGNLKPKEVTSLRGLSEQVTS
uniref:transmembrane protein 200C-like isoform X2 n=1 Tax=Monopterus albus TaxID=43700 RepID=UPI0009B43C6C|nr:transmembrane protein 200C-like isoform X2 [Monopterus albus]